MKKGKLPDKSTKSKRLWYRIIKWVVLYLALADAIGNQVHGQSKPPFVIAQPLDLTALPDSLPADKLTERLLRTANEKGSAGDWDGAVYALSLAIRNAPDSMRALPYGERSALYYAHKKYAVALLDLDSAIRYTPKLHHGGIYSPASLNAHLQAHWKWKGYIYADMGQYEAALASVDQAEQLLPVDPLPKYAESVGSNELDRGRYLTLQGNLPAAEASYRKAIDAYEQAQRSHVGIRLKVVELCLLTGQYDRAHQVLNNLSVKQLGQLNHGYEACHEYLTQCLALLNGSQTGDQAVANLSAFFNGHSQELIWRFTLTDTWLIHQKGNDQLIRSFRQLQRLARSRLSDWR